GAAGQLEAVRGPGGGRRGDDLRRPRPRVRDPTGGVAVLEVLRQERRDALADVAAVRIAGRRRGGESRAVRVADARDVADAGGPVRGAGGLVDGDLVPGE